MNSFNRDYSRSVSEDIKAWERMQKSHDADCRLAFLTGFLTAAFTILAFLIVTGGP